MNAPERLSITASSRNAMLMPQLIPPMSWERAVFSFSTVPTENTPNIRRTESRLCLHHPHLGEVRRSC
jgi:hypothetical protein